MTQTAMPIRSTAWYGWKPQLPDFRDYPYVKRFTGDLPTTTGRTNRSRFPFKPWNQGNEGSCTGHGWAGVISYLHGFDPSRQFIYYNERVLEGTVDADDGAEVRSGAKVLSKIGVVKEAEFPYNDTAFAVAPSAALVAQARNECLLTQYQALDHSSFTRPQVVENIKDCLASGLPFVFGFSVYESFESDEVARTGIVPEPGASEQLLGGHCVDGVDYEARGVWCRNSWDTDWGDNGYFLLPWLFFENADLSSDFWVGLSDAENPAPAPIPQPPQPTVQYYGYGNSRVYHVRAHEHGVSHPLASIAGYRPCHVCVKS